MKHPFWDAMTKAENESDGFTMTFYLIGGHVLKDVATSPTMADVITGERITEAGDRVPVTISKGAVLAYEIEES